MKYLIILTLLFANTLLGFEGGVISIPSLFGIRCTSNKLAITNSIQNDCMTVLEAIPEKWSSELNTVILFEGWPVTEAGVPSVNLDLSRFTLSEALNTVAEYHGGTVEFGSSKITVRGPSESLKDTSQWFAITSDLLEIINPLTKTKTEKVNVDDFIIALQESSQVEEVQIVDVDEKLNAVLLRSSVSQIKKINLGLLLKSNNDKH